MADAAEIEELKEDLERVEAHLKESKRQVRRYQREDNNELMSFWMGDVETDNKSIAVIKRELVEAGINIERDRKLEAEKGRFIGGFKYATAKGKENVLGAGRSIKEAPTLAKEAVIKKAGEARDNVWPIAGQAAKGAVVGAANTMIGAGKAVAGAGRFIKGIEGWLTGEKAEGSFRWLIWVGLAIYLIDWLMFDFIPNPTLINVEIIVMLIILMKHYGFLTRFDTPHIKRWIMTGLLSLFVFNYIPNIITNYGSLYGWFMFIPVALLSSPGVALLVFFEFDGLTFIASTFPTVLTTSFAFIFDARVFPFWFLFGLIHTPESKWARRIGFTYAIILIMLGGFTGETAFTQKLFLGQGREDIQAIAGERTEGLLEKDSLPKRMWLCGKELFTVNGDTTKCTEIFGPPDKEGEDELTEGGVDSTMKQEVEMEWITESKTISVGEEPSASARLFVKSLKGLIVNVTCGIKGKEKSGTAKPNEVQIEKSEAGDDETITCKIKKQNLLKEGGNSIRFNAEILGSQLEVSSRYVFYAMDGTWFRRQEEELLRDENEGILYKQDRQARGLSAAKLRLYEKKLLPGIIENMEDKIKRSYEFYPNERIESKSEPGFIKIKMSINNDVPFVGIKQGTELVFKMSVINTVPRDGKILGVVSGYVEMPEWLEPKQDECDLLDKSTRKNVNNRNRYDIEKNKLKIDWTIYEFGFSERKTFDPCKLVVNTRSEEIEGFELFDLNDIKINASLGYKFGLETIIKLNIKEGALAEIYLGDLDSFPVNKNANPTFEDDFGDKREDKRDHEGIDILAPLGTNIIAAKAGRILKIGCNELGGNRIGILDNNGDYFYYAHLDTFTENLKAGDDVKAGQQLGTVGDTKGCNETCTGEDDLLCGLRGKAPPPHLHFGIYRGGEAGTALNPFSALERLS